ncbi:MAG: RIO1 family regulatory kinase/ATPase domain-containing protein [Promethearchaeota archaeon]
MDAIRIKKRIKHNLKDEIQELKNKFSLNRLPSKKNWVYRLKFEKKPKNYPEQLVIKIFRTNNAEKEYRTLKKLETQELLVPKVLFFKRPYLILENIDGINLCDFINENLMEVTQLKDLSQKMQKDLIYSIEMLANWISLIHDKNIVTKRNTSEIIVLNKGDTRLRDFILNFSKKTLHGCDFEESYEGNHVDDLAWICCSLLDTDPGIFETSEPKHKIELINIFLKKYYQLNKNFSFSFNYFADRLIENLNVVIERRGLDISPVRKASILKNINENLL